MFGGFRVPSWNWFNLFPLGSGRNPSFSHFKRTSLVWHGITPVCVKILSKTFPNQLICHPSMRPELKPGRLADHAVETAERAAPVPRETPGICNQLHLLITQRWCVPLNIWQNYDYRLYVAMHQNVRHKQKQTGTKSFNPHGVFRFLNFNNLLIS